MLRFKKSIFILFAAIIVFSLSCCANNNSKSSPALWADGDPMVASTDQNSLDAVKWFSSKDKGKDVMSVCKVGCIGCKLCEKNCEADAIHVVDNIAYIDQDKCTGCGVCAEKCPKKIIK